MDQVWNAILDFTSKLVIPDWGALIALIPIAILALVVLFIAWLLYRLTHLGPRRRGKGRVRPAPPPDHTAHATTLPAVVHAPPPPGVHMPGPSFRPILAAIAVAVILYGLVLGGWLVGAGIVMLVVSLIGWFRDARAEYVMAERADESGHLEALPAPRAPTGTFAFFGALFVLALILNSGLIPSGAANGSTGGAAASPGGSPGASGAPSGGPAPSGAPPASLPATDLTLSAQGIQFSAAALNASADKAFTLGFTNDDSGIPHNVEIADGSGTLVFTGDTVTGVNAIVYNVPALKAGAYKFQCKWHPNMVGDLTVK